MTGQINQQNSVARSAEPPVARVGAPPVELSIRTMSSDMESLRQSGGTGNKPERIIFKMDENTSAVAAEGKKSWSGGWRWIIWLAVGIAAVIILFFVGYYLAPVLFSR